MAAKKNTWFEVDREGLAEIVKRRGGLAWLIQELISNSWDEPGVTTVTVSITPVENSPTVELTVIDDAPDGFKDLSHAWTLFAKSAKRGDADKRGRFNLGEKLVLAFCKEAAITTTTGQVLFDQRGRTTGRERRDAGSEFFGIIRMTRAEMDKALVDLKRLIPPAGITTKINGEFLHQREPLATWDESLWTELPDDEGNLTRRCRNCEVRVFRPNEGEVPMLYELGIPVVPLDGDPLHIDVRQKVPLNLERDNVTPSYLRDIRVSVLNHTHDILTEEDLRGGWSTDAMESYMVHREALDKALEARFGKDRVSADPSDREAENNCKAKGMTVVSGGSLPKGVWERVRQHDLIKPAGRVAPTPKPYHEGGRTLKLVDFETQSHFTKLGVLRYRAVCRVLLGKEIKILLADEPQWHVSAAWHRGEDILVLNVTKLGEYHFLSDDQVYALALHEIAHEVEGNHLSEKYHEEICRLAGVLACSVHKVAEQMAHYREELSL